MVPAELRYTQDHSWVRRTSDGTLTSGITDFAAKQLGEIVMVELVPAGTALDAGEAIGTIESVKAVTEVYAPVAGKITAVNSELNDDPEPMNEDPYGGGWMIKLKPGDANAYDALMTGAQYDAFVAESED